MESFLRLWPISWISRFGIDPLLWSAWQRVVALLPVLVLVLVLVWLAVAWAWQEAVPL